MIDRAVERDGPTYVRENVDRLLGGINIVMSIDNDVLEIPMALDVALAQWDPLTGLDPAVTRAQTRRAAEYLAASDERLGRIELVDALADGSLLNAATWWGERSTPDSGSSPTPSSSSITPSPIRTGGSAKKDHDP